MLGIQCCIATGMAIAGNLTISYVHRVWLTLQQELTRPVDSKAHAAVVLMSDVNIFTVLTHILNPDCNTLLRHSLCETG